MSQVHFAKPGPNQAVKAFFADSFVDVSFKKYKYYAHPFAPSTAERKKVGEMERYLSTEGLFTWRWGTPGR